MNAPRIKNISVTADLAKSSAFLIYEVTVNSSVQMRAVPNQINDHLGFLGRKVYMEHAGNCGALKTEMMRQHSAIVTRVETPPVLACMLYYQR